MPGRTSRSTTYGAAGGLVVVALVGVWLLLGGSGSSTRSAPAVGSSPSTTLHVAQPVGLTPSESAQMVCAREADKELASVLGATRIAPLAPTWVDHVYSCRYGYVSGVMVLSVKELSNRDETISYFASLRRVLGQKEQLQGIGQGAFITKNDSAVVRKDYKVLLVDTSGLPATFGSPPKTREQVAGAVSVAIMGCWTGA